MKMLRRNHTYEKFTKNAIFKKNIYEKRTKKLRKAYDGILADLGKHETRMQ